MRKEKKESSINNHHLEETSKQMMLVKAERMKVFNEIAKKKWYAPPLPKLIQLKDVSTTSLRNLMKWENFDFKLIKHKNLKMIKQLGMAMIII